MAAIGVANLRRDIFAQLKEYFERVLFLYGLLVAGRNLKNTPVVRELLPYPLLLHIIRDKELREKHLTVCSAFVSIIRLLYVDSMPHERMTYVQTVRIWDNVANEASTQQLTSRLTNVLQIEWDFFEQLKKTLEEFIAQDDQYQLATRVAKNGMILQMLMVLFHLLEAGFYEVSRRITTLRRPCDHPVTAVSLPSSAVSLPSHRRAIAIVLVGAPTLPSFWVPRACVVPYALRSVLSRSTTSFASARHCWRCSTVVSIAWGSWKMKTRPSAAANGKPRSATRS